VFVKRASLHAANWCRFRKTYRAAAAVLVDELDLKVFDSCGGYDQSNWLSSVIRDRKRGRRRAIAPLFSDADFEPAPLGRRRYHPKLGGVASCPGELLAEKCWRKI